MAPINFGEDMKNYHKIYWLVSLSAVLGLWLLGCATTIQISKSSRENITRQVVGQRFWLKTSQFGGQFYDDRRFKLLNPKPFSEITALTTSDGHLITPPPQEEIVSTGTQVTITALEWPTGSVIFKRPLYSPRHDIWIKLKVALDRGAVTLQRPETYIMLVPGHLANEADFMRWFQAVFSKNDTNAWLLGLDTNIRNAILAKDVIRGMDQEQLVASLGMPDSLVRKRLEKNGQTVAREIATYGSKVILLESGKVVEIHAVAGNQK